MLYLREKRDTTARVVQCTVDTGARVDDLERGSSEVIYLEFLFGFSQAIQCWTKQTLNASCEFGSVLVISYWLRNTSQLFGQSH